ncbi:hypothetical protein K435DRAFT_802872 [Dendrothele bispora CBS 962.96]|uniref:CHAT domain-containing protein n=1 Tax=Dendrothele bispora (strain CBS 962.96) TaxID=1314807 RepID=A0A4S8LJ98_DENBC|nr:hypothetical protein K435DRAFT_802872 [Dendrothele bispora CBS 962.96]
MSFPFPPKPLTFRVMYAFMRTDLRESIRATNASHGHADKAARLNRLGNAFQSQFEHSGKLEDIENAILFGDIENAILVNQQAVDLTPDGHAAKAVHLTNLGNAFSDRFNHLHEPRDIENAILVKQQAVDLAPDGHAAKAQLLTNLGNAFQSRFEHLGKLRDIENAILVKQQAFDLTPDDHALKAALLSSLGDAFHCRFQHLGKLEDIENAISAKKQAADLTLDAHAHKAAQLYNLGMAFQSRFEHLGQVEDIENAIFVHQRAVDLTPDGHADKATRLIHLANAFQSRFECLGKLGDITQAIVACKQATENTSSPPLARYTAASMWALLCSIHQDSSSALDAYTVVLEMIPQVVWFGQTVHHRYKDLPTIGRVINSAAAMAISVGDLPRAVEWLEEVRSIVWKQILQLRTPLDELRQEHPDIADELSRVSLALDNAGTSSIQNIDLEIKHKSAEEEAQNHHRMAAKYEELLWQVRELDGFGSFLRPKKFSELFPVARNGPVVVVNVSPILAELEQALYENAHHSLPHITWCATGPLAFLPLHAAGTYGSNNPTKDVNISDFAVSSYTTTLTTMLVSGSKPKQDLTKTPRVLIVSQPGTPNLSPLPGTLKEVEVIQRYASLDHTCHLTHESATVGAVLGEMSKHEIEAMLYQ